MTIRLFGHESRVRFVLVSLLISSNVLIICDSVKPRRVPEFPLTTISNSLVDQGGPIPRPSPFFSPVLNSQEEGETECHRGLLR